ncbi:Shikimate kinase [Corchorus capsularis]|uniref:Gluconate kinase n=1 Tax=Corchorus capsularis TaxID=210143 RepID=A0A1R3GPC5_COCAP|nr:Shikimate kinase [Corchorus capsularis]
MALSKTASESDASLHVSTFASRYVRASLPRFQMPDCAIPKEAAYQIINDELMLDGNPRLNLASFVTTWMEPECDKLIMAAINKNYVDMDEYPVTTELQATRLFNAPLGESEAAIGVGTVGSSEAIMLAGLAFKRKWQHKRKAEASGGFIAPFLEPELEWDFRLPLVKSINVSGHKYGLVYPGIGWVIWRSKNDLPEDLIFHINYLGADQPTFTLNFSKGSSQVIAQYYQLIRLGFEGYKNIMENCRENMRVLKEGLEKTERFNIISKDTGVPLVAFSLKDNTRHNEFEVSDFLRRFGWIVPAYTMPPDAQHVTVLRVVIREDFSRTLAERLVADIGKVLHELDHLPGRLSGDLSVGVAAAPKKSALETQREITAVWRNTIGNMLAKVLNCSFLDADDFHPISNKEKMRQGIPLSEEDRIPWLETQRDVLKKNLEAGKTVILGCSALQKHYRDILRSADAAYKHGSFESSVQFVLLEAQAEVLAGRLEKRAAEGKHFMPATLLQSQLDLLQIDDAEGIHKVDATLNPQVIVSTIQAMLFSNTSH